MKNSIPAIKKVIENRRNRGVSDDSISTWLDRLINDTFSNKSWVQSEVIKIKNRFILTTDLSKQ